jgi:formylglycine-generating enzyme required for sulfatase activity
MDRLMRRIGVLVALSFALPAWPQDRGVELAHEIVARKQVALVIGNSRYLNQPPLKNPVNDARAIAERLEALNYGVVKVFDANRRDMGRAIAKFEGMLGIGDVALFFYAGHGVQSEGENYLLPVDFDGQDEIDVRNDTYSAGKIQERMEKSGAQLNILILDACRNNPYRGSSRAGTRGLAAMSAGRGTFIAFATAPGRTASDGNGQNGLFTENLLGALSTPGLMLGELFDVVRERVDVASNGAQLPWTLSSVVGRYSFVPALRAAPMVNTRGPQPGDVKVNPKDGQRYAWIPPGTFMMGCSPDDTECKEDEKPAHRVTITKGFWLGQTSVTVGAWKRYAQQTGKAMPPEPKFLDRQLNAGWANEQQPIVNITWDEAAAYCAAAAGGRLPTEAEWEYAARAGTTGSRYGNPDDIAWYVYNSGKERIDSAAILRDDRKNYSARLSANGNEPKPVGMKQPNAWKLYDMLGNAYSWTSDWYSDKYYEQSDKRDPLGPPGGPSRIRRGGSWISGAPNLRVSSRFPFAPDRRLNSSGARCVLE